MAKWRPRFAGSDADKIGILEVEMKSVIRQSAITALRGIALLAFAGSVWLDWSPRDPGEAP
jgi:hypothetical protein